MFKWGQDLEILNISFYMCYSPWIWGYVCDFDVVSVKLLILVRGDLISGLDTPDGKNSIFSSSNKA